MSHVVVTVHGIRTHGEWQRRLEKMVLLADPAITFYHYQFRYFSILAFLFPPTRWLAVRRFRRELTAIVQKGPGRVDLVGHSFGTHLIAWALRRIPRIEVHTLILAGSVLRSDFYWADIVPHRVKRLVNDCGSKDSILLLSQFFVLFTGMAGRTGFVGMNGPEFQNRYSTFGHGGYFDASNSYMVKNWVPLLASQAPIDCFDDRKPLSATGGVLTTIGNNFEPIKISLYIIPLLLGMLALWGLYIETSLAKQRVEAVFDLARAYSARSEPTLNPRHLVSTIENAARLPIARTHVLWVDDDPKRNIYEKIALRKFGLCFTWAKDTATAMDLIRANPKKFSLVISDFRRDGDKQAGYPLLDQIKVEAPKLPFIFYVGRFTPEQRNDAIARGAVEETNDPMFLFTNAIASVNPSDETIGSIRLVLQELWYCPGAT